MKKKPVILYSVPFHGIMEHRPDLVLLLSM